MSKRLVAAIQMVSGADLAENLAVAERLIAEAVLGGAQLIVLPETFALFGSRQQLALGQGEGSENPPIRTFLSAQAKKHQVWIVGGTIPLAVLNNNDGTDDKVLAACFVFDANGVERARYDKIHLFDVDVADNQGSYRESDTFIAGDNVIVIDTPVGRLGLAVCYDIRFPELFRVMLEQQVDVIAIPAAFTQLTGEAHWLPLLRARAIENQCYVIGANQGGEHSSTRKTSGGSAIIDGWGRVLQTCDKGESVLIANVDIDELRLQRKAMPVAQHQRFRIVKSD
jgi:nitrilase